MSSSFCRRFAEGHCNSYMDTTDRSEFWTDEVFVARPKLAVCRRNQEMIQQISVPKQGSKELHFDTPYSKSTWQQFLLLLGKFNIIWWRTPEYNATRLFFTILFAFVVSRSAHVSVWKECCIQRFGDAHLYYWEVGRAPL